MRTRAGSEQTRRLSAEQSAQPIVVGAGSTAQQQNDQISILLVAPSVPASADESAGAEEETAMQQCSVRTRAGSEQARRLSGAQSAQLTAAGAGSNTQLQNNQSSTPPVFPAAPASTSESTGAEEETVVQQRGRQARAASRQTRLYGDSQPARLTVLDVQPHGSLSRVRQGRSSPTSRMPRGVQWYQRERRRAAAANQESNDTASD